MKDRSHGLNQYKERDESWRPDSSDESFFPGEYFGGDRESGSGWDRSYLVHDATPQAHCWSFSEDSDDLIENRQSWHHGEEKRDGRKRCINVKGKNRHSDAVDLRSKEGI